MKKQIPKIGFRFFHYFGGVNKKTGNVMQGGHSLPTLMKIKKDSSGYSVVDYHEPKDEDLYKSSLEKMFPERYSKWNCNELVISRI